MILMVQFFVLEKTPLLIKQIHKMKTSIFTLILIAAAFLIACEEDTIVGSGNIVSESRNVASFDEIEAGAAFTVFVSQGTDESLTVEADDNIVELISTEVTNGRLRIRFTESNLMFSRETMAIRIVMPELKALEFDDAATSFVEDFQLNGRLDVVLKDDADLDISGSASEFIVNMDDASNLKGFPFIVDDCEAELNDASKMEITANNSINGSLKDAAELRYKGSATVSVTVDDAARLLDAN